MQQDNSSFWTDIKAFEEQLAKSPDSFCFARLSDVYLKVGLVDDALHTARVGVAKHPRFLGGQRSLAMACHAKGLNEECLLALKLVTEAMPEDHQAQRLLGRLLADAGEKDAARLAFQTVLEFVPDDMECQSGLKSLDFSVLPDVPDEEYEEDIIEDLEILEEIDVFEEDQDDLGIEEQDQLQVPVPPSETLHDPLSTGTLAELYVKQGFIHKALDIYRTILADDPGNSSVASRISELDLLDTTGCEPEQAVEDNYVNESDDAADVFEMNPDDSVAAFNTAPDAALPDVFHAPEAELFSAPLEKVSAGLKSQGTADNALSTLEGWLENIRRVKSCH